MECSSALPIADIGTGPVVLRDYAQAAEGLGFDFLLAADGNDPVATIAHGASTGVSSDHARRVGTTALAFHDPFVLFGFLSGCTSNIGFATGVLILAQRQAALVAKQAASLDEGADKLAAMRCGVGAVAIPRIQGSLPSASAGTIPSVAG